jgi:hypothetical protein
MLTLLSSSVIYRTSLTRNRNMKSDTLMCNEGCRPHTRLITTAQGFVCFMVFNATFNNISVISWRSVLLAEVTGGPAYYPDSDYFSLMLHAWRRSNKYQLYSLWFDQIGTRTYDRSSAFHSRGAR